MVERIIKSIVAVILGFVLYWALSLIVTALSLAIGFAYVNTILAVIAGLMIIGVCIFIARLWGVAI